MQRQLSFFELDVDPAFGHWLAGFTDGEGCFTFYCKERGGTKNCKVAFVISLRRDDIGVLRYIRENTGVGEVRLKNVSKRNTANSKPQAYYEVLRFSDLRHVIIPLFEQYSLRSKKARDFKIWKQGVEIAHAFGAKGKRKYPKYLWKQLKLLEFQLKAIRKYKEP